MDRVEKTVFISYRRTDEPWGLAVFQDLTQHGYDVFIDYDGIASGNFETVILENIRARAHFLVLLTPTALERCNDPKDWMRREIEAALDSQRNIVPVMLAGFDFDTPSSASQLTGKLAALKKYNGLPIPKGYFSSAMERLRNKFLNVPVDAVLHTASDSAQQVAKEQKDKATVALRETSHQPSLSTERESPDIARLRTVDQRAFKKGSLAVGLVFVSLGFIALLAWFFPSLRSIPSAPPGSRAFIIGNHNYLFDFTNWTYGDDNSRATLVQTVSLKRLDTRATHFEIAFDRGDPTYNPVPQFTSPNAIVVVPPDVPSSMDSTYRVFFDVSRKPLNDWIDLQLTTVYYNFIEYAQHDISYPTDLLKFDFRSPKWHFERIERHVVSPGQGFYGRELDNKNDPSFALSPDSQNFTWTIDHPGMGNSYKIWWWLGHILFKREPAPTGAHPAGAQAQPAGAQADK